jgi:hypothetical protein
MFFTTIQLSGSIASQELFKERANVISSVSFHPHFFCTHVVPLHRESFAEQTERLQACFEIQFDL